MIIKYKYGFSYKEFLFGWKDKELFRLPTVKKLRAYPLRKLDKILIGNNDGYRIVRDRKTIKQLMEITEIINHNYVINGKNNKDTPF